LPCSTRSGRESEGWACGRIQAALWPKSLLSIEKTKIEHCSIYLFLSIVCNPLAQLEQKGYKLDIAQAASIT
jgi:hypothetical protein